ncbi:MAG: MFS transporter [Spirochaetota bacterium]
MPTASSPEPERAFSLRSFIPAYYAPAFLWATGAGVIMPMLPLHIRFLGASFAETGVIVGMFGLGAFVGNIPGGMVIGHLGKKRAMLLALLLEVGLGVVAATIRHPWVMAPIVLGLGVTHTLFFVARLAAFQELVPNDLRGRALSFLGGESRMGSSLGPVIGGLVADKLGFPAIYLVFGAFSFLVFVLVTVFVPGDTPPVRQPGASAPEARFSLAKTNRLLKGNRRELLPATLASLILTLVRRSRRVLFPLWGDFIGMAPSGIGLLFGASYLVELALVYPGGWIMDHWGRKKAALPCLLLFVVGFVILPFARTSLLFGGVAALVAVGNGLGSGINMTISTDLAPPGRVVEFLAVWRTLMEAGGAASPVIVGYAASAFGLPGAAPTLAAIGAVGALVMAFGMKETLKRSAS